MGRCTRWAKKILMTGVCLLLLTSPSLAYDQQVDKQKFETRMLDKPWKECHYFTFVRINAFGTADAMVMDHTGAWHRAAGFWQQTGSATVLKPGWIITAAHVVVPDKVDVIDGHNSSMITKVTKVNTTTILINDFKDTPHIGWIHYLDIDRDVALIRYVPRGLLQPLDPRIEQRMNGRALNPGDILAVITHTRSELGELEGDVVVKWGQVVSAGPTAPKTWILPWFSMTDFTTDLQIRSGDSGSLVFAFEAGEPIFIGVIRAVLDDGIVRFSYAAWIGKIINRILGSW